MNYTELVKAVAKSAGVRQTTTKAVLDEMCTTIRDTVECGEEVVLHGVGKFSKKTRSARKGTNPITKKTIEIPTTETVVFKVAKEFKDQIN